MSKLEHICSITSGQTFRTKIEHNPNGEVAVIQMKDMNDDYTGIGFELSLVAFDEISNSQILQKGDVLFLARGNNNKAFVFDMDDPAVAVSLFFVLRPKKEKVDPYYLAWFLNQPNTQNYLQSTQEGSTVASIKKQALGDLEIKVPSLNEQQKIASIYHLHLKEMELMDQIREKRNELINAVLIEKIY